MLKIRPHHLLDLFQGYDPDQKPVPAEYGNDVHGVRARLEQDPRQTIELVLSGDDICIPCDFFQDDGTCSRVLTHLDPPLVLQTYNAELDERLFAALGFESGAQVALPAFMKTADAKREAVARAYSPDGSKDNRDAIHDGIRLFAESNGLPPA